MFAPAQPSVFGGCVAVLKPSPRHPHHPQRVQVPIHDPPMMSGAVGQRGCCTVAGPQSDPSKNPNYRRGSQNDYWRKRTEDRRSSKGKSVSTDNQQR